MTMTCENHRTIITLDISSWTEIASAQQRMCILVISRVRLRRGKEHHRYQYPKKTTDDRTKFCDSNSISFPICTCNSDYEACQATKQRSSTASLSSLPPATFMRILDALHRGSNRIVLREWKQGACWWNLNMNQGTRYLIGNGVEETRGLDSPRTYCEGTGRATTLLTPASDKVSSALSMARAEVAGYRLATLALDPYQHFEHYEQDGKNVREDQRVHTPEVLYFSHDTCRCQNTDNQWRMENDSPWALFSFFDNGDAFKLDRHQQQLNVEVDYESLGVNHNWNISSSLCNGMVHSANRNSEKTRPCHHFPTTMTKIRHEFGFDEPHPRHGRVPTDECLDYAMMILHDVVIPIQHYFFMMVSDDACLIQSQPLVGNYLRSIGWVDTNQPTQTVKPLQYDDMIEVYRYALIRLSNANTLREEDGENDEKMKLMINLLDKCVDTLGCEWATGNLPPLPPVLCHMDLQPQNIFFCHTRNKCDTAMNECEGQHYNVQDHSARVCSVSSLMDWEEACFADPRFELLLICRKVLATREQAEQLWQSYSSHVRHMGKCVMSKRIVNTSWDVGSIEPWLKLETVHSLCTLLLQAMDLLGGGRNPWETTSDLWGKIDRERKRLVQLGWHFCEVTREL